MQNVQLLQQDNHILRRVSYAKDWLQCGQDQVTEFSLCELLCDDKDVWHGIWKQWMVLEFLQK